MRQRLISRQEPDGTFTLISPYGKIFNIDATSYEILRMRFDGYGKDDICLRLDAPVVGMERESYVTQVLRALNKLGYVF